MCCVQEGWSVLSVDLLLSFCSHVSQHVPVARGRQRSLLWRISETFLRLADSAMRKKETIGKKARSETERGYTPKCQ